jgi:hypothetical protein
VFLDGPRFDSKEMPHDGYGFAFDDKQDDDYDDDEAAEQRSKQEWFSNVTVNLPKKNGSGSNKFTHHLILAEYGESAGVSIVGGKTYAGGGVSGEVVGMISGALFEVDKMNETLQMAGDCLTEEVYEAMKILFAQTIGGNPKGALEKKCTQYEFSSILYIGGVFAKKDQREQCLDLEIFRAVTECLLMERDWDLVLLGGGS